VRNICMQRKEADQAHLSIRCRLFLLHLLPAPLLLLLLIKLRLGPCTNSTTLLLRRICRRCVHKLQPSIMSIFGRTMQM